MKSKLLLVFGIFIANVLLAQGEGKKPQSSSHDTISGPMIKFEEKSHDFGDITQGDKVNFTFKFKNIGTTPLIITNVLTTCGCTAPDWPKEPILPGGENEMIITFDSKGKSGKQNKVITVLSNGPQKRLNIITNVLPKPGENLKNVE